MIKFKTDFNFNKIPKIKDKSEELKIRYQNLKDVINVFNKFDTNYWLYGKTLLGMFRDKKLLEDDHDEDIGTWECNVDIVCREIYPELINLGFEMIRFTKEKSMMSFIRNNRYIDICFFSIFDSMAGYESKRIPKEFLSDFNFICIDQYKYNVPTKSDFLLTYVYKK